MSTANAKAEPFVRTGTCARPCYFFDRGKNRARGMVAQAKARGDLPRLTGEIPCVDCGAPARDYDHRDYNRPLDVEPVCRRCNMRRGPAIPATPPAPQTECRQCGADISERHYHARFCFACSTPSAQRARRTRRSTA